MIDNYQFFPFILVVMALYIRTPEKDPVLTSADDQFTNSFPPFTRPPKLYLEPSQVSFRLT